MYIFLGVLGGNRFLHQGCGGPGALGWAVFAGFGGRPDSLVLLALVGPRFLHLLVFCGFAWVAIWVSFVSFWVPVSRITKVVEIVLP